MSADVSGCQRMSAGACPADVTLSMSAAGQYRYMYSAVHEHVAGTMIFGAIHVHVLNRFYFVTQYLDTI